MVKLDLQRDSSRMRVDIKNAFVEETNEKEGIIKIGILENENSLEEDLEILDTLKSILKGIKDNRIKRLQLYQIVAKNFNTPKSVLEKLAEDSDWEVREAIAKNPNVPETVLEKLAEDSDWDVRKAIAGNPNTPRPPSERSGPRARFQNTRPS